MGCDIHLYAERRKKDTDQPWEPTLGLDPQGHAEYLKIMEEFCHGEELRKLRQGPIPALSNPAHRDYSAFARLGMLWRTEVETHVAVKDLPEDVSEAVQAASDQLGSDGHTHNWTTLAEIQEQCVVCVLRENGSMSEDLQDYIKLLKGYEREQPDYEHRIVFWFDN